MKENDSEIWCFDEPHESGGNVQTTMTRRQAIDWTRSVFPQRYPPDVPDETVFGEFVVVHWAYPMVRIS